MYCGTSGLRDFMYADIMEMAQFSVIMFSFATILRTFVMIYILDPLSEIMVRPERVLKFQQSAWRFVLYSIATISSIIVFMTDDTVDFKESSFFENWPLYNPGSGIKFMYALYAGFYIHQTVYIFGDERLDDFNEHVFHHAITLVLVYVSWVFNFTKIGFFIMTLHDGSDVFLELAKCMNYAKEIRPRLSIISDVSFIIFASSFFYLRLYLYPVYAIGSIVNPYDACAHVSCALYEGGVSYSYCASKPIYTVAIAALTSLYILQVMWAGRIINVIAKVIAGNPLEDSRE
ncbi:Longevity-assurance (LAG1) family protein [Emiliania huxleyi virus 99B1]|nr:Longevity-assurance (LAG1) family protein [Emiliania huxleyi virus 99B1]|mmetsp:Transcript_26208/g.76010  ORF Transcript_26208/g.76010 Transcript_26208/m.76010 type:complete len:289 (-) Transcript_26208:8724-9590(-)